MVGGRGKKKKKSVKSVKHFHGQKFGGVNAFQAEQLEKDKSHPVTIKYARATLSTFPRSELEFQLLFRFSLI